MYSTVNQRPTTRAVEKLEKVFEALRRSGYQNDAVEIGERWQDALDLTSDAPRDYVHSYPAELLKFIVERAVKGVADMECRLALVGTSDAVLLTLNQAWQHFGDDPASYQEWEVKAVAEPFALCDGKILGIAGSAGGALRHDASS